jgi:hypothetical protein
MFEEEILSIYTCPPAVLGDLRRRERRSSGWEGSQN